ncbi:MAG: hypothetical protein P8P74_05695 [Crocinitomicaceae bacterium]|nr:hypothetical protein [Crocinitomicaceae bacterium]
MIRSIKSLVVIAIAIFMAASCATETEVSETEIVPNEVAKANVEGEAYLNFLDLNDSLATANSLYYSREVNGEQEWIEVIMTLDDSSRILKMVEQYLPAGSDAVYSNHFYFKDGVKYATKEFFLESKEDSSYFVELLSYYDNDEKVTATKRRTAEYEDLLDQEQYMVAAKQDCSSDRAFAVVNQTGKFATTFQGFVEFGGFRYLIVGEDAKDGYSSALVVQRTTPLIMELRDNESNLLGAKLRVNFQTVNDDGSSQQILWGVAREI